MNDARAASEAQRAWLPLESWTVRVVCRGGGAHSALPLARYHHDAAAEPRRLTREHLEGGLHLRPWLNLRGPDFKPEDRRMHQTVPYWEALRAGDPLIPAGPWGEQPQWGSTLFGRVQHSYIFYCSRCPNPNDGSRRIGQPRKTVVESYRFVNECIREAVAQGGAEVDVSHLPEW